ncbi:branched-chain amino acid ABC transporter permease [Ferrovibrio sp.]|uniref:branched-chain amino acid ABC transporter permease n=1 Tax=Ferrovibrio sp. TaxID=1917215 RepID=UPI003D13D707
MRSGVFHQDYRSEEQLWDSTTKKVWFAGLLVALLFMPLLMSDYLVAMACIVGIHLVATLGLNITTGNAGQISLSHAAFMGLGCYSVAWLGKFGVPFFIALPLAGGVAALAGILVGIPSLRIKGLYLAIATLAAHFILSFIYREWISVTGGVGGIDIPRPGVFDWKIRGDRQVYYLILACVLILGLAAANLGRTYVGRAFIAVRDRDISAEILGVSLFRYKLLAFSLGSFYAGVAGALMGYFYGAVTPAFFEFNLAVFYLAAIILGGLGSVLGSVLGAVFMTFVPELLRLLVNSVTAYLPAASGMLLPLGQVVFGLLIIIFLVFEPHGLAEIWSRIRRTYEIWPFKT